MDATLATVLKAVVVPCGQNPGLNMIKRDANGAGHMGMPMGMSPDVKRARMDTGGVLAFRCYFFMFSS